MSGFKKGQKVDFKSTQGVSGSGVVQGTEQSAKGEYVLVKVDGRDQPRKLRPSQVTLKS